MNRILRPILSMRSFCALVTLLCFSQLSVAQVSLAGCPSEIVNVTTDANVCSGTFSADGITLEDAMGMPIMGATISFYSSGATINGSAMALLPITNLETGGAFTLFNFGVTQIVIVGESGGMMDECTVALVVTVDPEIPVDICDDITVDLANSEGCMDSVVLPDPVTINDVSGTSMCETGVVSFSFDGMGEQVLLLDQTDIGVPPGHTVFVQKSGNTATCDIEVLVEDSRVPSFASCPTDMDVAVAPGCEFVFVYDLGEIVPCDEMLMGTGAPSGTSLPPGSYPYSFSITDGAGAPVECSFVVTVSESTDVGVQLNCIGELNVSIDQNCEGILTVPTLLTGNVCLDPTLLELFVSIKGVPTAGPTITFTDEHVGQSFDVTVRDINGNNSCWGVVNIEDKIGPAITCPVDVTVACTAPQDTSATGVPTLVGTGCSDIEIFFNDAAVNNMCAGAFQTVISRRFFAVDGAGNTGAACTQTISVERESLISALLPPHWDGIAVHTGINDNGVSSNPPLSCSDAGIVFDTIVRADGRIVPSPFDNGDLIGTGAPGGVGTCGTIFSFYEDLIIDICEEDCAQSSGSYKVLRTWDLFDWCTGNTLIHQQIIKVADTIAPEFTIGVPDLTVSTDLWGCGATIYLPTVEAGDNCSTEITYTWGVTGGTYDPVANTVYVADNALTTVGEEVMLFAYAEDCCGNIAADTGLVTIVDLLPPNVVADEFTVVTLNNQSEDGHTKVHASTFDDGSFDGCGPIDYWVRRMDTACVDFDGDPDTEKDEINDFHKEIHFCCMDLEEEQMVVFMVCDDGDQDGVPEMNGDDNCNTAMVIVNVQDKLAPTINCPPAREIDCIEFVAFSELLDTELSDEDITKLETRFGAAFSNSTCGMIDNQTFVSQMDEVCLVGSVQRGFTVTTSNGQASCTQTIDIVGDQDNLLSCDRIAFEAGTAEANANYDWCDPSDLLEPFVTPIQITECGSVDILEPLIDRDGLCTEVGINLTLDTFNFAGGACVKILAHWEVIDQCFFDENFEIDDEIDPFVNANGYYELYVEYDIFDTDAPVLTCDDVTVETTDCDANYDSFTMDASDDCTSDDLISITYAVDLGNTGIYDIPGGDAFAEGNTFNAATIDGGLPIGTHSIKWIAYDGCGNYEVCIQEITVEKQSKAPTPYCHLGLSSAVMDEQYGCEVEFWASDFAVDGFDDCDDSITVLMIPYQDIYQDPADLEDDLSVDDALAMAMPNWTFGCEYIENGVTHVVEIRVYFVDEDGVYDFCDASLTLNDNFDCCPDLDLGGAAMITGNVATEEGEILESVDVSIMSNHPEFPRYQVTSDEGSYTFNGLPKGANYELTANNQADARKGVTTLDIVLIQRHILGITLLDSPYKLIAADVNGNEKVSAVDLLQLRKLILGLYNDDRLPENDSWRYVDYGFEFADSSNPFPFSESVDVVNLNHAMYNQNFVGVKIGDVNGSVSASIKGHASKRSNNSMSLVLDDQKVEAGSELSIDVLAGDLYEIYGLQFGLSFDPGQLEFRAIEGDAIAINDGNFGSTEGSLSLSWNETELKAIDADQVLFTLVFDSKSSGNLSDFISIDNDLMKGEAYDKDLAEMAINLDFRDSGASDFSLSQNSPNPFDNQTSVSFVLPEAGNAYFQVFDVTGKLVKEISSKFEKGANTISIKNKELGAGGVYYYQLTFGKESASRKMILLD